MTRSCWALRFLLVALLSTAACGCGRKRSEFSWSRQLEEDLVGNGKRDSLLVKPTCIDSVAVQIGGYRGVGPERAVWSTSESNLVGELKWAVRTPPDLDTDAYKAPEGERRLDVKIIFVCRAARIHAVINLDMPRNTADPWWMHDDVSTWPDDGEMRKFFATHGVLSAIGEK